MIMGGMGLLGRMKFSKKKYLGKMMVVKITRRRDLKKIRNVKKECSIKLGKEFLQK